MIRATVRINNKLGLHARASAKLSKLAGSFRADVSLSRSGRRVNAKSIMGVMMLAAGIGSEVENPEARHATPKKATQTIRMVLRPNRSASGPKTKAPAISPAKPAPNTGASCPAVSFHSARMAGAT